MLANSSESPPSAGTLRSDLHVPLTFYNELLDFIEQNLPLWRDDVHRPADSSETALTEYLCDYLNSSARLSSGWDILQFRTETMDESNRGRKIDLTPKPCGVTIQIDGRRHTQFDSLLPIECKRLPTPIDPKRDEREYVYSRTSTTGGIQRFKIGAHGSTHPIGAMIAYIQKGTMDSWRQRIAIWITKLAEDGEVGWSPADLLREIRENPVAGTLVAVSSHTRSLELPDIELRHLWIRIP